MSALSNMAVDPQRQTYYMKSNRAYDILQNTQQSGSLDISKKELGGRSITNRMELSGEINQDLFLCLPRLAWSKSY